MYLLDAWRVERVKCFVTFTKRTKLSKKACQCIPDKNSFPCIMNNVVCPLALLDSMIKLIIRWL